MDTNINEESLETELNSKFSKSKQSLQSLESSKNTSLQQKNPPHPVKEDNKEIPDGKSEQSSNEQSKQSKQIPSGESNEKFIRDTITNTLLSLAYIANTYISPKTRAFPEQLYNILAARKKFPPAKQKEGLNQIRR